MRFGIAAYDGQSPCQFVPDLKGEGVALSKDLKYFQTGTQVQPSFPKV